MLCRRLVASIAALVTLAGLTAAGAQTPAAPRGPRAYRGRAALQAFSQVLPEVARRNGWPLDHLRAVLAQDNDAWVDEAGQVLFTCTWPAAPQAAAEPGAAIEEAPPFAYQDTFRLHSRPGSQRTVYLDFDGHTTSGTSWNNAFTSGAPIVSAPFDADGDPSSFSAGELETIQRTWLRVVEDYAPLNVDVTTEDPGVEALRRTSTADAVYGTRVVVSPTDSWYPDAGGVAYVGVFDSIITGNDLPCFVFSRNTGNNDKGMAEAGSHEAGHTLGLSHDGTSTAGYYEGHGDWAPIMGVGYYRSITQWSKGEYSGANNTQDDFVVMSSNGGLAVADDHAGTLAAATALSSPASGVISTRTDVDVFRVTVGAGSLAVSAAPASVSPNLDIQLTLYDANGAVLATADPVGLPASLTRAVSAGTYYVSVDGVGAGNPLNTGYSDYGSVGAYTLNVTGTVSNPRITVTAPNGGESWTVGTTQTLTWTSTDVSGGVKLEYSTDAGGSWTVIQANTANDGTETWTVPNAPTSQGRIRVTAVDGSATDQSDASFTIAAPPSTASAQFVGIDSTTQGTWKGVYGADGYQLVGDGTQLPAYAQVSITGATTHLWGFTDLVQALQRATEPGRIAACWYAPEEFTVNLNLTDGQVHRVAFYSLDFDWNNARAQRVEVLDAATGTVLDSRSLADYALGKYLVWNLKGNLKLRFIRTGFANSVLSGLFFGGASTPGTSAPGAPTQLTGTAGNGQVALAWTGSAGATSYTVKRGTASGGPYTAVASSLTGTTHTDTGLTNGTTYYYVATATGPGGESGPSNQASATPTAPPAGGGASAQFVGSDSTTQGTWKGVYGAEGYQLVGDRTQLPAYAQVGITGAASHVWGYPEVPQALQRGTDPGRIAACWYAPEEFTVNLNLTDGQVHRVAFYCLDYDWNNARAQRVEVLDAATGAVLDSRSLQDYSQGKYLVWNLKGNLKLRFLRTGFTNSVLSGLFFGPAGTVSPPAAPANLTATAGDRQVALSWSASTGATSYTVKRGTTSGGPYTAVTSGITATTYTDTGLTNGTAYYYVVTATGVGGESGPSNQAAATPTAPPAGGGASAQFVAVDSTTQGSWKGVYGADGYQLVGDATLLPAYAQVSLTGAATHVWGGTDLVQALQRATEPGRLAACWYAPDEFTVNLNLTDGQVHRVAFYCLDFDWNNARAQRVEVLDAATGAVLDSRSLQDYALGKYLVWNLKGNLKLRFIRTGFTNSVLSGVFFN